MIDPLPYRADVLATKVAGVLGARNWCLQIGSGVCFRLFLVDFYLGLCGTVREGLLMI